MRIRQAAARRLPQSLSGGHIQRYIVSRYATAWAESLVGAISGHQSRAVLCRYRCRLLLAEIFQRSDRNAELKQRLHLWKRAKCMSLMEEYWGSSTRDLFAGGQEPCSHKLMNSVEEELALFQPEDPAAKP